MLLPPPLLLPLAAAYGPAPGWNAGDGATKYAAFSVLAQQQQQQQQPEGLEAALGPVQRGNGGEPLFRPNENPWETNIDNGYSSVLYDPADSFGLGRYRVYYSASVPGSGGAIPGESASAAMLYATSDDGIVWHKPALHRYNFGNNSANNILFHGTSAVAIYDDGFHDTNASSRFKAWGNLPGDIWEGGGPGSAADAGAELGSGLGFTAQLGGSAVSANGLNWTDYRRFQAPSSSTQVKDTLRFDAAASVYFDQRTDKYTGTMRAFRPCDECGGCPIWWQPHGGCQIDVAHHKDDCSAAQCNRTVRAIGASFSSTGDFKTTEWGKNTLVQRNPEGPERQFYSQISFPFYK